QLGLFDVSIGLTARHGELARQRQGSLPHALPSREQPVGRIETFRLLRIGRSRHLLCKYYLLRRKSSTQRERSSPIPRSRQKLPFAFGEWVSPVLANLFLHYAFDRWIGRCFPSIPFERYADDIICHCRSEAEARRLWNALEVRFRTCRLVLHPTKTK